MPSNFFYETIIYSVREVSIDAFFSTNFRVIQKAKKTCKGSNYRISEHFANVGKTLPMPEELPTPEKSLKELAKEKSDLIK